MSDEKREKTRAIAETIRLLRSSQDGGYNTQPVQAIIASLMTIQDEFDRTGRLDTDKLSFLFGPTGTIQEISMFNGWADQFLRLAQEVDKISNH